MGSSDEYQIIFSFVKWYSICPAGPWRKGVNPRNRLNRKITHKIELNDLEIYKPTRILNLISDYTPLKLLPGAIILITELHYITLNYRQMTCRKLGVQIFNTFRKLGAEKNNFSLKKKWKSHVFLLYVQEEACGTVPRPKTFLVFFIFSFYWKNLGREPKEIKEK